MTYEFHVIELPPRVSDPEDPDPDPRYTLTTYPVVTIDSVAFDAADLIVGVDVEVSAPEFEDKDGEAVSPTLTYQWGTIDTPLTDTIWVYDPDSGDDENPGDPAPGFVEITGEAAIDLTVPSGIAGLAPILRVTALFGNTALVVYVSVQGVVGVSDPTGELAVLKAPSYSISGDGTVKVGNKVTVTYDGHTIDGLTVYTPNSSTDIFASWPLTRAVGSTGTKTSHFQEYADHNFVSSHTITASMAGDELWIRTKMEKPAGDTPVFSDTVNLGVVLPADEDDPYTDADYVVSNKAGLSSALSSATNGQLIHLEPGNYGSYTITGVNKTVTVGSKNPANKAVFTDMVVQGGSHGLTFRQLKFDVTTKHGLRINSSNNVTVESCDFITTSTAGRGMLIKGLNLQELNNCDVIGNLFRGMTNDAISASGVDDSLIADNDMRNFSTGGGQHHDAIQFHAGGSGNLTSENVTIRNNYIEPNDQDVQQIYIGSNVEANNFLIEDNTIIGGHLYGIKFIDDASNITIRNNIVVRDTDNFQYIPEIETKTGSTGIVITGNTTHAGEIKGPGTITGNIVVPLGWKPGDDDEDKPDPEDGDVSETSHHHILNRDVGTVKSGGYMLQHMCCITRSVSEPKWVFIGQDVSTGYVINTDTGDIRHCGSIGPSERRAECCLFDIRNSKHLLLGVGTVLSSFGPDQGLWASTDRGHSFTQVLGKNIGGLAKKIDRGSREGARGTGGKLHRHFKTPVCQDESSPDRFYYINQNDALYGTSQGMFKGWDRLSTSNMAVMGRVFHIEIDPFDGNVLHVAAEGGYFRSDNIRAGTPTFTKKVSGLPNNPTSVYPNGSTRQKNGKTIDISGMVNGGDWVTGMFINRSNGTILLSVWGRGVYQSTNGGDSWSRVYNDSTAATIFGHRESPNHLYLFRIGGNSTHPKLSTSGPTGFTTMKASNLGVNTGNSDTGTPRARADSEAEDRNIERNTQYALSPHHTDTNSAFGSGAAIFLKLNKAQPRMEDMPGQDTYAWGYPASANNSGGMYFHPSNPLRFGYCRFDVGNILTTDGWDHVIKRTSNAAYSGSAHKFLQGGALCRDHPDNFIGHVGKYHNFNGVLSASSIWSNSPGWYASGDVKATGDNQPSGPKNNPWVDYHPTNQLIQYCSTRRSKDRGRNWHPYPGLPSGANVFGMHPDNGNILWAIKGTNQIYRSINGGDNFNLIGNVANDSIENGNSRMVKGLLPHPDDEDVLICNGSGGVGYMTVNGSNNGWVGGFTSIPGLAGKTPKQFEVDRYALTLSTPVEIIYAYLGYGSMDGVQSSIWRNIDRKGWVDVTHDLPRSAGRGMRVHPLTGDVFTGGTIGSYLLVRPSTVYGAQTKHGSINASMSQSVNLALNWQEAA